MVYIVKKMKSEAQKFSFFDMNRFDNNATFFIPKFELSMEKVQRYDLSNLHENLNP